MCIYIYMNMYSIFTFLHNITLNIGLNYFYVILMKHTNVINSEWNEDTDIFFKYQREILQSLLKEG